MKQDRRASGGRRSWLAAGVACALLALAGCGSSSKPAESSGSTGKSTSSSNAAVSNTSEQAVSGEPIVVGNIGSYSGAVSSTTATDPEALAAWEKWTNAHGGINGHPVKVISLDDGLEAATTVKDAKQLVEQDHVMAIVGEESNLDGLWASYVKEKGIPVIGAAVYNSAYESNPDFFATGAQNPTEVYGDIEQAKKLGDTKIGVMYCAESPSCATYSKFFEKIGKAIGGVSLVFNQKITGTEPNYNAPCLAAKEAGANLLAVLHASTIVVKVVDSCGEQGYKPAEVNLSFTPGTEWQTNPNLQGLLSVVPNQSLWEESIPATKEYEEALDKYAPGIQEKPEYNPSDASVWAAAQVFKLAGERAKIEPKSTPEDVKNGLYTFKEETLEGLTAPLTYKKGQPPTLVSCYFESEIKEEKWIAPEGAKPLCVPKELVPTLESIMTRE